MDRTALRHVLFGLVAVSACFISAVELSASAAAVGSLPAPVIFAPGVISGPGGDGAPAFSPDGSVLFFTRSAARWSIILESHRASGNWSEPRIASFSGEWSDSSPAFSPDGSYIIFVSTRPMTPDSSTSSDQKKDARPQMASHIWRVNRQGSGWGAPVELPATVNFCRLIFRPSVASDGTIYFTAQEKGKELRLFRSLFVNGSYRPAEPLPFSDGTIKDVDPEIAPDQSFLIFSSRGRWTDDNSHEHLFMVRKTGNSWGEVIPLRYEGDDSLTSGDDNDPRLSPDQHTIYFSSDRSVSVVFPRTAQQARQDFDRMQTWDNGNTNVWTLPLISAQGLNTKPDSRGETS